MATAAITREEEENEILKCGICRDSFSDPRQLKCRHVFCLECVDTHYKLRGKNCAPCPICRENYWPPHNICSNLSKCPIPLCQLLDIRKGPDISCEADSCEQDGASFLCLTCRKWLCTTCKNKICISVRGNSNGLVVHQAYRKEDIDPDLFHIVKRSRKRYCCRHQAEEVEWYCPQPHCRALVCRICEINSHLHHDLLPIEAQTATCRQVLESMTELLRKKEQEHRTNLEFYTQLIHIGRTELFDAGNCQTAIDVCENDSEECDNLVKLITHLLEYGENEVMIETCQILEERIRTEFNKCHSLDKLGEVFNATRVTNANRTGMSEASEESCEASASSTDYNSDSGIGSTMTETLNSTEGSTVPYDNTCESAICVRNARASLLCLKCRKWICDSCNERLCSSRHETSGDDDASPTHHALPPADIDPVLYEIVTNSKHNICHEHAGNIVDLYCPQCQVSICTVCNTNSHLHHKVVDITNQARVVCRDTLEDYNRRLRNQVRHYLTTQHKTQEIINSPFSEILNVSYLQDIILQCISGSEKSDRLRKTITYILRYGSERVIVDMSKSIKREVEDELKVYPREHLESLRRMASSITDNLNAQSSFTSSDEEDVDQARDTRRGRRRGGSGQEQGTTRRRGGSGQKQGTTRRRGGSGQEQGTTRRHGPGNPNSSEECKAKAHVNYFWDAYVLLKSWFHRLGKYLSGSG